MKTRPPSWRAAQRKEAPMTDATQASEKHTVDRVARAFLSLGRVGFWIQFVFLIIVAILGAYVFAIVGARARTGNVLAFLGLALPIFTTFWCWRYTQYGRSLAMSGDPATPGTPTRMAWVGTWAGTVGVIVSILSLFGAASTLLIVMLANPQVGIQISPVSGGATAYTVSAVDALSLMSLLLTLTAELIVVAISLRLIFLVTSEARKRAP
jgi:hypothetical protein